MPDWKSNAIMEWSGTKVTDHGRQPLTMVTERIGTDKRMVDGTLRRQHISNKRTWTVNWENLPSRNDVTNAMETVDGGMSGTDIETFYQSNSGSFRMVLRRGSAIDIVSPNPAESALPYENTNFYVVRVMITEFTKDVVKRGKIDLWNVSVTLEEV